MMRLCPFLMLVFGLAACPSPVEGPSDPSPTPTPTAAQPTGAKGMPGPPPSGSVPKGGDQLQREIGALSKKGLAIKDAVTRYLEANSVNGLLKVDDSFGGTVQVSFVRYHDPVREKKGKGYIVLSDFVVPDAQAGAFYTVGFWLKDTAKGIRVTEIIMQGHPELRDGAWVRIDHFEMNDEIALPLQ